MSVPLITYCPGTLANGFTTYSRSCLRTESSFLSTEAKTRYLAAYRERLKALNYSFRKQV